MLKQSKEPVGNEENMVIDASGSKSKPIPRYLQLADARTYKTNLCG